MSVSIVNLQADMTFIICGGVGNVVLDQQIQGSNELLFLLFVIDSYNLFHKIAMLFDNALFTTAARCQSAHALSTGQ